MFTIKKENIHLLVRYCGAGEVFILSDMILTAFDFSTRTVASTEAALASEYLKSYVVTDQVNALKHYYSKRGWVVKEL